MSYCVLSVVGTVSGVTSEDIDCVIPWSVVEVLGIGVVVRNISQLVKLSLFLSQTSAEIKYGLQIRQIAMMIRRSCSQINVYVLSFICKTYDVDLDQVRETSAIHLLRKEAKLKILAKFLRCKEPRFSSALIQKGVIRCSSQLEDIVKQYVKVI